MHPITPTVASSLTPTYRERRPRPGRGQHVRDAAAEAGRAGGRRHLRVVRALLRAETALARRIGLA